jgi:hypothetical protein
MFRVSSFGLLEVDPVNSEHETRNIQTDAVKCYGSRFVLSRGSVGEIERDASYQRDEQACDEYGRKAEWCDIAVVQEGQQNGRGHGQSEAQHVTLQIDRFAWFTSHVRRVPSDVSSTFFYCFLEGEVSTSQFSTYLSLHKVAWLILECARRTSTF